MEARVRFVDPSEMSTVTRALDSPLRRRILELVFNNPLSVTRLSEILDIPQSTCTLNVQMLRKANLLTPHVKGRKLCCTCFEEVVLPLNGTPDRPRGNEAEVEMPIGLFSSYKASPPCGLASQESTIGFFDHPASFLDPRRASAQIIWLSDGFLEYLFPSPFPRGSMPGKTPRAISLTAEVCSEYPGYKNDWLSDITVWINGTEIGTWTCPGDMGGVRGRLTPEWWSMHDSQYGFKKTWRVSVDGSFIDGVRVSDTTIGDIDLGGEAILVRIGVKEDAEHKGGLNLFGRHFGNYEHDLLLRTETAE